MSDLAKVNPVVDRFERPLSELRVSVTDRCNFRCRYCMPREHFDSAFQFMHKELLLSFEEIRRLCGAFANVGVRKLRLTGGEPLLRSELPKLVGMLRELDVEITLTTNGVLLPKHIDALVRAGLDRVTISLDALDPGVFKQVTDANYGVEDVLEGIAAAERAGLSPLKINCVVRRGMNENEITAIARRFCPRGHVVRFIEYMDVGKTNGWQAADVVSKREMLDLLGREAELLALPPKRASETASRYRYGEGPGEVGIIASVTEPFCRACNRARLSADGHLYTCLFASVGTDLKTPLRAGQSDTALCERIATVWRQRADRYSELRASQPISLRRVEMSYIGG